MNEHPILFSTEMVKAILDGRKTQTRRVVKNTALSWLQPEMFSPEFVALRDNKLSPYGYAGDMLWVRETFCPNWGDKVIYKADGGSAIEAGYSREPVWKPSIFMPRWASRITLEVVNVRVERVQDISRDDAILEGLYSFTSNLGAKNSSPVRFYCANKGCEGGYMNPVEAFENLWDAINGKRGYSFESNPFVWVVEFKKI